MARCEDYPCCGHTSDDPCPDRDADGRIIPRCCECGKRLPRRATSSICATCQGKMAKRAEYGDDWDYSMND